MTSVPPLAAITGATGFLGRYVTAAFLKAGWRVRLLVRRDPNHPQLPGLNAELVFGDLFDMPALRRFSADANVVIHVAGRIKARDRSEYFRTNETGSVNLGAAIATCAPAAHVINMSSLAARAPYLSDYAASKAAGEQALSDALDDRVTHLRPAAIYGPWDMETLVLFRLASRVLMPVPAAPATRICFVAAQDVAAAVLALANRGKAASQPYEISDGVTAGYSWMELANAAIKAVGHSPRIAPLPTGIWPIAGWASEKLARITGQTPMLSRGKARELLHPDWASDPARQLPISLWSPIIPLETGFDTTVTWARGVNLLPQNRL